MSDVPGTDAQYEDFLIDSGSTSHWASSLEYFANFDYFETEFNLADNKQTVTSVGTGDIQFTARTINDKLLKVTIRGVHHSPQFANNILSVDCLIEDGFNNPDFTRRTLTAGDYHFQLLPRHQHLPKIYSIFNTFIFNTCMACSTCTFSTSSTFNRSISIIGQRCHRLALADI